jgi:hypothetical protein
MQAGLVNPEHDISCNEEFGCWIDLRSHSTFLINSRCRGGDIRKHATGKICEASGTYLRGITQRLADEICRNSQPVNNSSIDANVVRDYIR